MIIYPEADTNGKVFLYEVKALGQDEPRLVLKAYASPDGQRLRIVLPDLVSYAQVHHCVEGSVKYLEFNRVPPKGATVIK